MLLLKPGTYMNLSGDAVRAALAFYKLEPADVTVLHDELDLAAGKVRVKRGGGAAGHNGIRSIDAHIGPDFTRVRLGIGHPGDKRLVTGHVLGDFVKADAEWLDPLLAASPRARPASPRATPASSTTSPGAPPPPKPARPRDPASPAGPGRRAARGQPQPAAEAGGPVPVSVAAVRAAFGEQERICTAMGSPFTGRSAPSSPTGWPPAARSPIGCSAGQASLPTAATPCRCG